MLAFTEGIKSLFFNFNQYFTEGLIAFNVTPIDVGMSSFVESWILIFYKKIFNKEEGNCFVNIYYMHFIKMLHI